MSQNQEVRQQLMKPAEARSKTDTTGSHLKGKVLYLLIVVGIVQLMYPITADGSITSLLIYEVFYGSVIVIGILVARGSRLYTSVLSFMGVAWIVTGIIFAFNQENRLAQLMGYLVIIIFQIMVTKVLIGFVFAAKVVTRDVIYAATAVYLLIGAIFVPLFGLIETITYEQTGQHAFSDAQVSDDEFFPWQSFNYYSYVTLTTMGYGDILPLTMAARSAATLEAILGVIYITVVMGRLIGLYAAERSG